MSPTLLYNLCDKGACMHLAETKIIYPTSGSCINIECFSQEVRLLFSLNKYNKDPSQFN